VKTGVNLFKRIGDPVKFKTAMLDAKEQMGFDDDSGSERRSAGGHSVPDRGAG